MTGFEPRIPGVRSNRSTNCATTTAQRSYKTYFVSSSFRYPRLGYEIVTSLNELLQWWTEHVLRIQKIVIFVKWFYVKILAPRDDHFHIYRQWQCLKIEDWFFGRHQNDLLNASTREGLQVDLQWQKFANLHLYLILVCFYRASDCGYKWQT